MLWDSPSGTHDFTQKQQSLPAGITDPVVSIFSSGARQLMTYVSSSLGRNASNLPLATVWTPGRKKLDSGKTWTVAKLGSFCMHEIPYISYIWWRGQATVQQCPVNTAHPLEATLYLRTEYDILDQYQGFSSNHALQTIVDVANLCNFNGEGRIVHRLSPLQKRAVKYYLAMIYDQEQWVTVGGPWRFHDTDLSRKFLPGRQQLLMEF